MAKTHKWICKAFRRFSSGPSVYRSRIHETSHTEGQFFVTVHDEEVTDLASADLCREYTRPRDEANTRARGWVRRNTRIGLALEVIATNLLGRYGVDIKIDSLQNNGSQSWVVICSGTNKYVTDVREKGREVLDRPDRSTGKLVATTKAHTYSSVSVINK